MGFFPAWGWVLCILVLGSSLEYFDSTNITFLSNVSEVYGLLLPARVEMEGSVSSIRDSRGSMVFDLVNNGRITCYHRHPSLTFSLFSRDWVRVVARIEETPMGRLCVVEELRARGFLRVD